MIYISSNNLFWLHSISLTVRSIDSMYLLLSFLLQGGIVNIAVFSFCLGKGIADLE